MSSLESEEVSAEEIRRAITERGHWFMPWAIPEAVNRVIAGLGRTILVTDENVAVLDFHTDHHRADLIAWHCIEQTDQGGETVLLDGYKLLRLLAAEQLERLKRLQLFKDEFAEREVDRFPFLSERFAREKIYYSPWSAAEVEGEQREALQEFTRLTERGERVRYLLQPGDLLVIDNGRMLHGSSATGRAGRRVFRRYWIEG